jgi:hypothetical protein
MAEHPLQTLNTFGREVPLDEILAFSAHPGLSLVFLRNWLTNHRQE